TIEEIIEPETETLESTKTIEEIIEPETETLESTETIEEIIEPETEPLESTETIEEIIEPETEPLESTETIYIQENTQEVIETEGKNQEYLIETLKQTITGENNEPGDLELDS
ncbi:MAG: hypothetical protein AB4060_09190, partial [Crocosphaera sp.]